MSSLVQLRAIFCGNVQGVGFRWTVVEVAEQYNLTGTASNLRNGTVEVIAQGERATLEQFVAAVEANPGIARITSVTCKYSKPEGSYSGFQIM